MGLFDFIKRKLNVEKEEKIRDLKPSNQIKFTVETKPTEDEVIPVKERIKGIEPSDENLYPHEILVLSYAPTFYSDGNNNYQGFWWYRYGIKDVNEILESLLDRGFLKVGSLESAMWKATVAELKDILRENDKKVSGKKEVLIKRLLDEVEEEKLNKIFVRRTYETTDLGEVELGKNEYIPYIHKKSIEDLDIFSLTKLLEGTSNNRCRDVIWGYLNKKGMEHIKNNNFGLYTNSRLTMSDFVYEEGKIDNAFSLLVEVIRYDLSGLYNGFDMEFLYIYKENFFPYENSFISLPPGIVAKVVEYKESKQLSDDELRLAITKNAERITLPFSVFTVDECVDIVMMEINEDKDGLTKIYDKAEKRFNKKYNFDK